MFKLHEVFNGYLLTDTGYNNYIVNIKCILQFNLSPA